MGKKGVFVLIFVAISVFLFFLVAYAQNDSPGSISGTVYDYRNTGQPLAGVNVCAYYPNNDLLVGCNVSGEDGSYTIGDIGQTTSLIIKVSPSIAGTYAINYYPDKFLRQEAQPVGVSVWSWAYPAPADFTSAITGIDFHLVSGGSISGQVNLSDIPVCVETTDGIQISCTQSDSMGNYQLLGLISQNYLVRVERPVGFIEQYYPGSFTRDGAISVQVNVPQNVSSINFSLPPVGSISGIIFQDGNPIILDGSSGYPPPPSYTGTLAGTQVCAVPFSHPGLQRCTKTDNNGFYKIDYLAEDSYRVWANPVLGHAGQYYPTAESSNGATPITVAPPNETTEVNLTLPLAGFGNPSSVSGTIYDDQNPMKPVPGVTVCAYFDAEFSQLFGCSTSGTTGSYWIGTNTLRSTYSSLKLRLQVHPTLSGSYAMSHYPDQFMAQDAQPIDIYQGKTGIDFHLVSGGSISGKVNLPDIPVCAETTIGIRVTCSQSDSEGNYQLIGLISQPYLVRIERPAGFIEQYYSNSYNISGATTVLVTAPQNKTGVDFSLPPVGSISGTVTQDGNSNIRPYPAPPGTQVSTAYDKVCAAPFSNPGITRCSQTNYEGNYTIYYLAPDNYRVWADPVQGHDGQYFPGSISSEGASPVLVTESNDSSRINIFLPISGNSSSGGVTPTGTNVTTSPVIGTIVTYTNVTTSGTTTILPTTTAPPVPSGFSLGNTAATTYYDINTTATFIGPVTVCLAYDPAQFGSTDSIRLLHYENQVWKDVTINNTGVNNVICGLVNHFSPFALVRTIPEITFQSRTAANVNGWNNTNVTLVWMCSNSLETSVSITLESEGSNQSATGKCEDKAGHIASDTQTNINIDKTPPILTPTLPSGPIILKSNLVINSSVTDILAGIATQNCTTIDTSKVGPKTVTCTGADNAGNSISVTISYNVIYRFDGFLQPINDTAHQTCPGCQTSIFKGNSTVPVKFQLKDVNGNVIQAGSLPLWIIPQQGGSSSDGVDETIYSDPATNGNLFTVDGDHYAYNWKTKGYATGYFWRIGVKLDDGQTYYINIGLR